MSEAKRRPGRPRMFKKSVKVTGFHMCADDDKYFSIYLQTVGADEPRQLRDDIRRYVNRKANVMRKKMGVAPRKFDA